MGRLNPSINQLILTTQLTTTVTLKWKTTVAEAMVITRFKIITQNKYRHTQKRSINKTWPMSSYSKRDSLILIHLSLHIWRLLKISLMKCFGLILTWNRIVRLNFVGFFSKFKVSSK